jgi:hypothetical protein
MFRVKHLHPPGQSRFTGFWDWLITRSSVARFEEAFVTGGLAPSIKSRGRAVKPKVPRQGHGKNTTVIIFANFQEKSVVFVENAARVSEQSFLIFR